MNKNEKFVWKNRLKSFRYAFNGFVLLLRDEHNARLHVAAALIAILAGLWFGISPVEWVAIIVCIGMVISAEAFNSAIESLADRFGPERHPLIGKAKDIAAAGVLVLALASLVTGMIIFIPRIWNLFM